MADLIGPHGYAPIRWWDAKRLNGRCLRCYQPHWLHPLTRWHDARPTGDHSKAHGIRLSLRTRVLSRLAIGERNPPRVTGQPPDPYSANDTTWPDW